MSLAPIRLALLSIVLTSALVSPAPAACPPYTIDYGHGQCVPIGGPSGFPRGGIGSGPDLRDTRGTRDDKPKNVPPLTTTTTSSGDKVSQPKNKAVLHGVCPPDTYRTSTGCRPLSARPRN